mmetsp:Transcript_70887/g.118541  ORF Transcript_70887/g.118541 Transcript_70887/m.118541 type:complete len:83 (+) Transcript_70887:435-683(+)
MTADGCSARQAAHAATHDVCTLTEAHNCDAYTQRVQKQQQSLAFTLEDCLSSPPNSVPAGMSTAPHELFSQSAADAATNEQQ